MITTTALRIRQSTLRHLEEHCPRMAYALSVEGREGPSGGGALRGQAVHEFFRRYVEHLYRSDRQTDWEGVQRILSGVFGDYPTLTWEQREDVTAQAENIARGFLFRRDCYYGSEESFETTITLADGCDCTITGRLDYLEIEDALATIYDVKSNHAIWPDSTVANDFQLRCYALLVLDTLPSVQAVRGRLLLSRYGLVLPQRTEALWTREDLESLREHLAVRLAAHFGGELRSEAVPGTWCAYCPLRRVNECTLYRSYYGTTPPPPLTERQSLKYARQVVTLEDARETRLALLKQYVNEHGPLALGSGAAAESFAFHTSESEDVPASDLLALLDTYATEIGPQPLDDLLTVNRRGKAYRALRGHAEIRAELDAIGAAHRTTSTRFGHKSSGGGDE
jgi:hypothetical protein